MEREWRAISWAHNYEVSNYGEVRRIDTKTMKDFAKLKSGSLICSICGDNQKYTSSTIASLVAEAFIKKPKKIKGRAVVIHKDRDKSNNRADNLQYISLSDYMKIYVDQKYVGNAEPIAVKCIETGREFYSISETAKIMGIDASGLSKYLRKSDPNLTYKGFHFVRVS